MEKMIATGAPQALAFAASYAALLILTGVGLSLHVVRQRRRLKIGLGDGGDRTMARAIRMHGNFSEYAPLLLVVLIALPLVGAGEWLVHLVGVSGLTGRLLHAIGLHGTGGPGRARIGGMFLTFLALTAGALALPILAWR